jgi:glycosyltransferase involved in cell wall biosynthesis
MRLLLIARCPPYPLYLGDRLIVYHLARELHARGWQIDLLALHSGADDPALTPDARRAYEGFFARLTLIAEPPRTPAQILRRLLSPGARFPHSAQESWSSALWEAVSERVRSAAYDAVHVFGGVQVYDVFGALGGHEAVITPYESYSLYLRRQIAAVRGERPLHAVALSMQRWIARAYEGFMFTPYARAVVVSEQDAAELRGILPTLRIEVIANGVDLPAAQTTEGGRDPLLLLFTGNFAYAPNIDAAQFLAQVLLPQVRAQFPKAHLALVGSNPPEAVRALANAHVEVTGSVPDLTPWLARAAVYVCPLRFGAGIKNKVLEALAHGCAVAATPLSADGIAARHEEELLIATPDTMSAAVIRLLRDPTLRQRLGAAGRALVATRYTWAQVAQAYEQLYGAARRSEE